MHPFWIIVVIVLILGIVIWSVKNNSTTITHTKINSDKGQIENEDLSTYIKSFEEPLKKTLREYVQIKATLATNLPIDASKFGGIPYIPVGKEWPKDKDGNQYIFLAQTNMSEVPPLEDFPTTGILQFFVPDNDVWGLNFDDMYKSEYKVIFYENTEAKAQEFPFPKYKSSPIDSEFAISFNSEKSYISFHDFRFNTVIADNDFLEKIDYDEKNVVKNTLGFPLGNDFPKKHQIGGYPYFTQWDPRDKKLKPDFSGDDESVLLFQMDSQMISGSKNEIMWGDLGVANFFISRKDLREKKFDRILYNWDCG